MSAPEGLGSRGRTLLGSIVNGLPDGWELDERELALLTLAARQADDLEKLEGAIEESGPMTTGSAGQPVVSPALVEARQARLAIGRLLGQLALPGEDRGSVTESSRRGQRAARTRWNDERRRRGTAHARD